MKLIEYILPLFTTIILFKTYNMFYNDKTLIIISHNELRDKVIEYLNKTNIIYTINHIIDGIRYDFYIKSKNLLINVNNMNIHTIKEEFSNIASKNSFNYIYINNKNDFQILSDYVN